MPVPTTAPAPAPVLAPSCIASLRSPPSLSAVAAAYWPLASLAAMLMSLRSKWRATRAWIAAWAAVKSSNKPMTVFMSSLLV